MGILKGPLQFTGSVGNFRCYYDKASGKYVIATKGGQTREQIENNPTFVRQRENMNEFKLSAMWASLLQKSLSKIDHLRWGYYFPKINAMGKTIIKHDDIGIRGFRSLESSKVAGLLKTINFNKLHLFDEVLTQPIEVTISDDKQTVTLKVLGLNPFRHIKWTDGYVSFRLTLVIAILPDWHWNTQEKMFKPVIRESRLLSRAAFSEWYSKTTDAKDVVLQASFSQPALQEPGSTVVVALGIEFSLTKVEPTNMTTYGIGTMKIVDCFI
jgi:hypothetical protein